MSRLGLVVRQIRADLAVVLLLATVLAVGAFLGAAAPPWINDRLDAALEDTLSDAAPQGDLVARGLFGASVTIPPRTDLIPELAAVEEMIEQVRRAEPALTAAYTNDRWSLSIATGMIAAHDGPAEPSARQREMGLWLPQDAQQKVTVVEGRFPRPDVEIVDSPASTEDRRLSMPVFEVAATADVVDALELEVGHQVVVQAGTIGTQRGTAPALLAMGFPVWSSRPIPPTWCGRTPSPRWRRIVAYPVTIRASSAARQSPIRCWPSNSSGGPRCVMSTGGHGSQSTGNSSYSPSGSRRATSSR